MGIETVVLAIVAIGLALLVVAWFRAIRKSRALGQRYLSADPDERRRLERQMELDGELEAYMRPLAHWEIVIAGIVVLWLLYAIAA